MAKNPINIVWFKRDLRFTDHEPLYRALESNIPVLLVYFFEPSLIASPDSDVRHWRFVHESLVEMQGRLEDRNGILYLFHSEVLPVFQALSEQYDIRQIFSHQEIGNDLSFQRDKAVAAFCSSAGIAWNETPTGGVIRRLKSRKTWQERWEKTMRHEPYLVREDNWNLVRLSPEFYDAFKGPELPIAFKTRNPVFQEGGEYWGWKYLKSFIESRHKDYSFSISKPEASRRGCSRISPYLAYGNISMRMAYTFTMQHYKTAVNKRGVSAYFCHDSYAAHVLDLEMKEGAPAVQNVVCAVDCGIVINPDGAKNLSEGGIVDGIGAAMFGKMTIEKGVPQSSNFDTYRMIRHNEAPKKIEVHFVKNEIDPTGMGEPAYPPVFGALANALYQATGKRHYRQPFSDNL